MDSDLLSPTDPTIATTLHRLHAWLVFEVAQGDPSPNTLRSYLGSAKSFLLWCHASNVNSVTACDRDIKEYRAHLVQCRYQPATISTYLAGVRRLYDAMVDWGWRKDNPADQLQARRDRTSRSDKIIAKYIPDRSAFLKLFEIPDPNTIKGKRDRAILRILCYTGLRVSELCALDKEDLKLDDLPSLTVRAGKGRKCRHIPLGEQDAGIIRSWLDARNKLAANGSPALLVSLGQNHMGHRLTTRGARGIVDHYLRLAGLKKPGRSCHALRHSAATWLLDAGVPMQAIADLLGHSSVDTTAIYARIVDLRKYTPSEVLARRLSEAFQAYQSQITRM